MSLAIPRQATLHTLGASQLDFAQIAWDRLQGESSPPGAITPSAAKSTLTRDSQRKQILRRQTDRQALFLAVRALSL